MNRSPVLVVCGTRPEAIKLAPVVDALRARGVPVVLVATGQHPDLAPALLAEAGLVADVELGAQPTGSTPVQLLATILSQLAPVLNAFDPSMVLVQGDTVSALAGALAAAYAGVPVGHVEAGLRTGDRNEPFPEEMQRVLIAPLAQLHFAPTQRAAHSLQREGVPAAAVHVTGNTSVDAMIGALRRLDSDPDAPALLHARFPFIAAARAPVVLATVHRRENLGRPMHSIAAALARLAAFFTAEVVIPLHPNPLVHEAMRSRLGDLKGVHLIDPVGHAEMLWLMRHARLLLTDSGGLQEEAPSLGLRTLVLRGATERQEAIECGAAELVERSADSIVRATRRALAAGPLAPANPFGDGTAASRIARIVDTHRAGRTESMAVVPNTRTLS